jgi:hypothetical protein
MLPWLVAFSNTASEEVAVVVEYDGPVIAEVLQPSMLRVTAQVDRTGKVLSSTMML